MKAPVETCAAMPSHPLEAIQQRVLWLSTSMIHHANRIRPNPSGLKVGGHQASCASMVSIMTSLWFEHLQSGDRVSVKPHASPVLHSINYLLGKLDESNLTTLREFGGLQSYPSRAKDPDPVDYSTGSVGIGATAPIWGAMARRYVNTIGGDAGTGRQYSLVGDAELDEGAVWEAILDPGIVDLGEVVWIVDLNRQSLDRVVPNIAARRLEKMFDAAGWQVITVKFGKLLETLFTRPGGAELRDRILEMPNPEYQRLLRCDADELRNRLPGNGKGSAEIAQLIAGIDNPTLTAAIGNLGGHDLSALSAAYRRIDDTRPTIIFAYTIKGYGLPIQGHPQNHSSLLSIDEYAELASELGMDRNRPWQRFDDATAPGQICAMVAERLHRDPIVPAGPAPIPSDFGRTPKGTATTQSALGRVLLDLTRAAPDASKRVVTVSPDVSSTTNLAGWVNKVGVWSSAERHNWFADDTETILHWREKPTGQHMELGIAETNLVGLIGELGATWSRWGSRCSPSESSTIRSSSEPSSRGPTAFMPAGNRSWSAHHPVSPWLPKAEHTNPSRHPRSVWNNRAVSATNPPSPSMSSGPCWPACPASPDRTAPRPTYACRPAPSTSNWQRSPRIPRPANAAADRSSQVDTH